MTRDRGKLGEEDKALWDEVTGALKPRPNRATHPASSKATPISAQVMRHREPVVKASTRAPPQDRGNEKRVRRGKLDIGASLDLHGHTQTSGRAALNRFLCAARNRGDGAVVVITGVGRGGEGVLKRALPEWLADPALREVVSGFAPAHRTHGGAGAFYVFIRRKRLGNEDA